MVSRPCCWPLCGSVGKFTWPSGWPESSTTPAFIEVPPTSKPINRSGAFIVTSFSVSQRPFPFLQLAFQVRIRERHARCQTPVRRSFAAGPSLADLVNFVFQTFEPVRRLQADAKRTLGQNLQLLFEPCECASGRRTNRFAHGRLHQCT